MDYIVLDLEWNQPPDRDNRVSDPIVFDSEIIEIGAVKLNDSFEAVDEFKIFVKPVFYPVLNGDVSRLTHIRPKDISDAMLFPEAFQAFADWCGEDFSFCTWGNSDIPVIFDNMIMHEMDTSWFPDCYDLQRIFDHEVMRDDRQCSLEKAMEVLNQTPDQAHDALNDVKNTVKVCNFMDLDVYMEEYRLTYVHYPEDRLAGLVLGKEYANIKEAKDDNEFSTFECPYCGGNVEIESWRELNSHTFMGYGKCPEGDEYLAHCHRSGLKNGSKRVGRVIYEMNDDFWDIFQKLEENSQI